MAQNETDEFVWEDPPPRGEKGVSWELGAETNVFPILEKLKARPDEWARVYIGGGYGSTNRAKLLREAGCEVRTVRIPPGSIRKLYARFVG